MGTKNKTHCLRIEQYNIFTIYPLAQGSATLFQKRAILQHLPADMTIEEPQNVHTVLYFKRLHRGIG